MRLTREGFLAHRVGSRFRADVDLYDDVFDRLVEFFDDARARRMEEAEIHHNRPALAGVLAELLIDREFYRNIKNDGRFRQIIGGLVHVVMAERGWLRSWKQGSLQALSRREAGSLFTRAARYVPPEDHPCLAVWEVRHESRNLYETTVPRAGMTAAQEMRGLLEASGYSEAVFAELLGVSYMSVRRWMRRAALDDGDDVKGEANQPSVQHLEDGRNAFGWYLRG